MSEKTEYQPNLPIGMLTERDLDAYERIGWHAWADGIRHENCPFRDGRQMPWQFGWCAAEQNYRKAVQNYRKAVLDARTDQSPATDTTNIQAPPEIEKIKYTTGPIPDRTHSPP